MSEPTHFGLNAAMQIANHGRFGDSQLAYLSAGARSELKRRGGSGTINPKTGLLEYFSDDDAAENDGVTDNPGAGEGAGGPVGASTRDSGDDTGPEHSHGVGADTTGIDDTGSITNEGLDVGDAISQNRGLALAAFDQGMPVGPTFAGHAKSGTLDRDSLAEDVMAQVDARVAQDPTAEQLDRLEKTEKAFAANNPGVVGFAKGLFSIASMALPGAGALFAAGNLANIMGGKNADIMGGMGIFGGTTNDLAGTLGLTDFGASLAEGISETFGGKAGATARETSENMARDQQGGTDEPSETAPKIEIAPDPTTPDPTTPVVGAPTVASWLDLIYNAGPSTASGGPKNFGSNISKNLIGGLL